MSDSNHSVKESGHEHGHRRRCCSGGRANWSMMNIGVMVFGFIMFWPIGLFLLFWIMRGRDVAELPGAIRNKWEDWGRKGRNSHAVFSDNVVFNDYQQAQLDRISELREEMHERARRFHEFRDQAQRRKDEEEFNRFMADAPPVTEK